MDRDELIGAINEITGGNQSEYARLTGITPQQLRKLLSGRSGISGQTKTIAQLLLLCKEEHILEMAVSRLMAQRTQA